MSEENTMHQEIRSFILNRKIKKKENLLTTKLLKEKDGGLNKILISIIEGTNNYPKDKLKEIVDRKRPKDTTPHDFQLQKYQDLSGLVKNSSISIDEQLEVYEEQRQKVEDAHVFATWLDENCQYAEFASVATHVTKLTHSSNKGTSFYDNTTESDNKYLTTSILKQRVADGTYENALYSPVVALLLVESNGRYFYEDVIQSNYEGLEGFENSAEQLSAWKQQLKKSIDKPSKSSDSLSKQIYFPVVDNPQKTEDWHLVSVLASSSLAQDVFSRTGSKDFNDKNRSLKTKYRNKSLFSEEEIVNFPKKATLMVTQSSHQNTSILNGKRSGRLFLLPSTPPTWTSQIKPPLHHKSWFDRGVPFNSIKEDIEHLKNFILRFDKTGQSTRDPKKQRWLIKWGRGVLSTAMLYAETIQNLPAGWSSAPVSEIKLKSEQQYFLDPYRMDGDFQTTKDAANWQSVVASDFAQWLNKKIQGKDKKFTPQAEHTRLWQALMLEELREHTKMVKVVIAANKEEQA
ncbi:type I-F CRISPR-associated protein Csy1 [Teredinibacter purpureus]|uniref:type I-F CRISPR-associated protein Csy1 n=1 Tax=Teredinibacter purpureus TaxID=2731756 RepID=UPI0005F8166C|nr:type I-F CRISPR-associated protein Csy1 [Teredinibacter purpureus]